MEFGRGDEKWKKISIWLLVLGVLVLWGNKKRWLEGCGEFLGLIMGIIWFKEWLNWIVWFGFRKWSIFGGIIV